jgi:hypothetical protein
LTVSGSALTGSDYYYYIAGLHEAAVNGAAAAGLGNKIRPTINKEITSKVSHPDVPALGNEHLNQAVLRQQVKGVTPTAGKPWYEQHGVLAWRWCC